MRKRFLYVRLALTNLKNNRQTYFPYMITSVTAVMTFYIMYSISQNQGLASMPGATALKTILLLGAVIIGIFAAILLFYTNSFLIRRRKKELGLYGILGMEKKHIALVLFWETLFIAASSLGLGLLGGMLLSKLLFLILLNLLGFSVTLAFSISIPALTLSVYLFGFIFFLTFLTNLKQIRLSNPITLMQSARQGEKEPKTKWLLAVLGVVFLSAGYTIAIVTRSPLQALLLFFVAVLLVILGTYALFTAGSIAFLKILRKNKQFYYKPTHFVSVSGMIYRMKQNAAGLASICILSTMVLVTISTTVCLYIGIDDALMDLYPYDIRLHCAASDEMTREADKQALEQILSQMAEKHDVTVRDQARYRLFEFSGYVHDDQVDLSWPDTLSYTQIASFAAVPLEDYNALTQSAQTLQEGEVLLYCSEGDYAYPSIQIGGESFSVKEVISTLPLATKSTNLGAQTLHLVVKDEQAVQRLGLSMGISGDILHSDYVFNLEGSKSDKIAFSNDMADAVLQTFHFLSYTCRPLIAQEIFSLYGGFLFLGVFLGLLFLMATVLIIYYKQISEGYDDHTRFEIMQKVGMSAAEVKHTISRQILCVFFLPLAGAVVHVAFAFPMITRLLSLFSLNNIALFATYSVVSIVLFSLFYTATYLITARSYYRLVR